MKCYNPTKLLDFIKATYKDITTTTPDLTQTKIDFPDKLVVNVYSTGTVTFQGNCAGNAKVDHITKHIETINANL